MTSAPHGKAGTYANHGCRCDECRSAMMASLAESKARRFARRVEVDGRMIAAHLPPEMHGREGTYGNHGCRCEDCTAAWSQAAVARRYRAAVRKWTGTDQGLT